MRLRLLPALLVACATPTRIRPRSLESEAPPLAIPALPPEESSEEKKPKPPLHEIAIRLFKNAPTACDPLRTHVPCIYKGETWCMFHDGEHADEPIACEAETAPALVQRVRVCLDLEDIAPRTHIMLFDDDDTDARVLEPTKSRRIRLCSTADRMWRVDIGGRRGTLDWTKTNCHTLDARRMTLRLGCDEPFERIPVEDRL